MAIECTSFHINDLGTSVNLTKVMFPDAAVKGLMHRVSIAELLIVASIAGTNLTLLNCNYANGALCLFTRFSEQ
jgi:hypothetical protein